jgi:hypothetical protein
MENALIWAKRILFITLILFVAFCVFRFWQQADKVANKKTETKAKSALQHPQAKPINTFKDASGDTHIQIQADANQVSQKSLKDTSVTNHTLLDSNAIKLKIKDEQIAELTRVNLKLAATIQLTPTGNNVFSYTDANLQLTYYTLTNTAQVKYQVRVSAVKFTPASLLPFNTKPAVLDFSTDDPRATIGEIDQNSVIAQPAFIGFSASGKASYFLDTKTITPALEANLRLGRWHVTDTWYYQNSLKQSVGAAYDLVKINP